LFYTDKWTTVKNESKMNCFALNLIGDIKTEKNSVNFLSTLGIHLLLQFGDDGLSGLFKKFAKA